MMENSIMRIDVEKCTKCGTCVNDCPRKLYYFKDNTLCFADIFEEFCLQCGHCVAACPDNIIQIKESPIEEVIDLSKLDKSPSFDSFLTLIKKRRSIRQFKSEPVPKDLIEKILEMARYTPTGHNEENIHYTVVQDKDILSKFSNEITKQVKNLLNMYEDPEGRESLKKTLNPEVFSRLEENAERFKIMLEEIDKGTEIWRWDAELIIIHSPKNSMTPIENASIAASYIMLAAEILGLGTCSLGYATAFLNTFRTVSKIIKLPRNHFVNYSLAIGYPNIKYFRVPARKQLKSTWF